MNATDMRKGYIKILIDVLTANKHEEVLSVGKSNTVRQAQV